MDWSSTPLKGEKEVRGSGGGGGGGRVGAWVGRGRSQRPVSWRPMTVK